MPVFQSPNILALFLGFLGIDAIIKQEEVLSAKREVSFHNSSNGPYLRIGSLGQGKPIGHLCSLSFPRIRSLFKDLGDIFLSY